MFTSDLAKVTWLLYSGLILAGGALSQGWRDEGFSEWTGFMHDFDDFESPPESGWNFGFANGLGGFFERSMRNAMRRTQRQMRFHMTQASAYNNDPDMKRLIQEAREAFAAEEHRPGFRRIVRTGSCGPGCRMKVVLTRDNGAYSERVYQSSS